MSAREPLTETEPDTSAEAEAQIERFAERLDALVAEVGKIIVGQTEVVDGAVNALVADGHVLLEGIPGVGKTKLVRTLADALHLAFSRIQFTPDLMPADIVGAHVFREDETGRKTLEFQPGPIFAQILLADEINRATPKTQSALLEAMQERTVTVGTTSHQLEEPFLVLATQNPIEMEGTYPLPEAQVDRFFYLLRMSYPSAEEVHTIIDRTTGLKEPDVETILTQDEILELRRIARTVPIAPVVQDYAVRLVLATRPEDAASSELVRRYARFGSSPRGAQTLIVGAKVNALRHGRAHVSVQDIKDQALPALRHRILLNFEGQADEISTDDLITSLLDTLPERA